MTATGKPRKRGSDQLVAAFSDANDMMTARLRHTSNLVSPFDDAGDTMQAVFIPSDARVTTDMVLRVTADGQIRIAIV